MGVYFLRVPWLVTLFLFYLDLLFPFPLFSLSSSSLLPCLAVFDHGGFLSGIWVLGVQFPEFRPSELTVGPFHSCYCSRQKSSSFIYYSQIGQLGFTVGTCWLFWSFLFPGPFSTYLSFFPPFLRHCASLAGVCNLYQTICILKFRRILSHLILLWCCPWVLVWISVVLFLCGDLGGFKNYASIAVAIFLEFRCIIFQTVWGRDLEGIDLAKTEGSLLEILVSLREEPMAY